MGLDARRHDDVDVPIEDGDGSHRRRRCSSSDLTPQLAPCRRNPKGAGVFAPQALSFVGHEDYASFRSSFRACDPNTPARDPTDFHHGLLASSRHTIRRHRFPPSARYPAVRRLHPSSNSRLYDGVPALLSRPHVHDRPNPRSVRMRTPCRQEWRRPKRVPAAEY